MPTLTGRLIVTGTGPGVHLTAGRGLDMNRGAGRLITSAAGFTTTTTGPGLRAATFIRNAVGGGRRWLRSSSTSRSGTTSAGIRCRITSVIRIHVTTVRTIVINGRGMVDQATVRRAGVHMNDMTTMKRGGVALRACRGTTSEIRIGAVSRSQNRLHAEWSMPSLSLEICRVVTWTTDVQDAGFQFFTFRINRPGRLNACRVWHWMMSCDVRVFSVAESRDRSPDLSRDPSPELRSQRKEITPPLRQRKLNLRVWSIALNRRLHAETAKTRETKLRSRPLSRDQTILHVVDWCGR
jgi:hypothetical protein